jgi:PKD repeat protein
MTAGVHPLSPAAPCSSYTVWGYVNFTTNLGLRSPAVGANIWVNWTQFTNESGGPNSWFIHAQATTLNGGPAASYQFDLPTTGKNGNAAGCGNGDTLTLSAYYPGIANATASNSTTVNTANPGSQMDVLLKAPALTASIIAPASPDQGEQWFWVNFTSAQSGGTGGYHATWMFGDGSWSSTQTVANGSGAFKWEHLYKPLGTFDASLFINDSLGDSVHTTNVVIEVVAGPVLGPFTADMLSLNTSWTDQFSTTIANGQPAYSVTYQWGVAMSTFTHSVASSPDVVTHSYNPATSGSTGTQVNVSLVDAKGKTAGPTSVTIWIYDVSAHAASNGIGSLTHADVGQTVAFTGTAIGGSGAYAYLWRFADGGSATTLAANHAFAAAGTYVVNFTVNDTAHVGNTVWTTYTVLVNPTLTAALVANRTTVDVSHYVSFNASAGGGWKGYAFNMSFGGGVFQGSSAAGYYSHQYNSAGTFSALNCANDSTLVVACSTIATPVTITVGGPLSVSGQVENNTLSLGYPATSVGYVGEMLRFASTGTSGSPAYSYGWIFGDGSSQTWQAGATTTHTYATAGPYTVTFQIKDQGLDYATATELIQIYPALTGVTISDNLTAAGGEVRLDVAFNASVNGGTGVPWYHFNWTLGNGISRVVPGQASSSSPMETDGYVFVEVVTVNVTVADNQGERAYASLTFTVVSPLSVSISGSSSSGNLNPPVNETFSTTITGGSGTTATWTWDLGGGNVSGAASPKQTYWSSGTYTVTVVVKDSFGDKDGATFTFTVTGTSTYQVLSTGWNLIAMPGIDQGYDLWFLWEDLVLRGANPTTTVVSIQNTAGGLPLNYTFQGGAAGSAAVAGQSVGDARGIWVYVAASQTIGLSATTTAGPLGAPTSLQAGWNNLGWVLSGASTASAIAAMIPGATQISIFSGPGQTYTTYIVGFSGAGYNFAVSNGEGLLVYVPAATSFTE